MKPRQKEFMRSVSSTDQTTYIGHSELFGHVDQAGPDNSWAMRVPKLSHCVFLFLLIAWGESSIAGQEGLASGLWYWL